MDNTDKDQCENVDDDVEETAEDTGDGIETEAPVYGEDPTWMPEGVDEACVKLGDDCDDRKETDSGYVIELI